MEQDRRPAGDGPAGLNGKPDEELLRQVTNGIVAAGNPDRVILFGSAARGEMGAESDVDLLVVMADPWNERTQAAVRGAAARSPLNVDLAFATPEDVADARGKSYFVTGRALAEGRCLHGEPETGAMADRRDPKDATLWLEEAKHRLDVGRQLERPGSEDISCEQAHYAAEMALKGLLIARKADFVLTHDNRRLLEQLRQSGEDIPREVEAARKLTQYAGAGRYDFDRTRARREIGVAARNEALETAGRTIAWAERRIGELLG